MKKPTKKTNAAGKDQPGARKNTGKTLRPDVASTTKKIKPTKTGNAISDTITFRNMELLLNNTDESFILIDTDLNIVLFNSQFQKTYSEYFGKSVAKNTCILDYAQPARREILERIYCQVFAGETLESEINVPHPVKPLQIFANRFKPAYNEKGEIFGAFVTIKNITESKNSQQQLVTNERRFRALVENGTDAVAILSADAVPFYVSPSVISVLGYNEEEILQQDVLKLLHPADIHEISHSINLAMANPGMPVHGCICRVLHKNGSWRWVEATLTNMLHDPAIGGIVDNFRDITDKILADQEIKKAEKIIREERALLRTLIDNLPMNVFTKDLNSRKTLSNRTDYLYAGFTCEEDALGRDDTQLFTPELAKETLAEDKRVFTTGKSMIAQEACLVKKDGTRNWFLRSKIPLKNEENEVTGLIGLSVDITERKETEEKIRIAKERYDMVMKATNEAVWEWNIESGEIHWGDGIHSLFGYDPVKNITTIKEWDAHIHPEDAERVIDSVIEVSNSTSTSNWMAQYRFLKSDGNYAHVLDRGFIIRNTEGKATRMIGSMQDITEKIIVDQALRDSEEKTRLIMNSALDAIVCMDIRGNITFWNPQAEKIFGWKQQEVLGQLLSDTIIPPAMRSRHNKGMENYLKTGHGPALNKLMELSAIDKENKEFPIELSILPIRQGKEEFFCAFVRDITQRKAIEQQLNDASSFNQTIIETAPIGIWIYEEDGQCITVNQAGAELGGGKVEELLKLNFRKLDTWKQYGLYDAAIESLESGELVRKEVHGVNVLDHEVWFDALLTPIRFKGRKHLLLMTYDIRDRMTAETALKKSEKQLSVATQLARLGYWELNIEDSMFTFNDHFYSTLRTTAEEVGGYTMRADVYGERFLHPADGPLVQEEIRLAIETTDPNYSRNIEHRIIYPNGEIGYLAVRFFVVKDENNRTIKTIGANQDITHRKMAEEQLRLSKERYDMVGRATNDVIYEWDIVSDTNYWGEGFETLFGHKRTGDFMPSATWVDNLHPDERDTLLATTFEAFQKKQTSMTRELRFRCADGSYKTVFDNLVILYDEQGKALKIVGAMQDITERKKNELAISKLNEQLNKRAEELAASNAELQSFAYVASHDLQEPLRMVSSFLQLLQRKYETGLDETAIQYIGYAVDGADRMKRLIHDLLEYSRVNTSEEKRIKTDICNILNQVIDTYSTKIRESAAIIKTQLMPSIRVNRMQITQLLQNLVGNALKYNTAEVPEVEIGCEEKEDEWQFFVKDNGIGIDPKYFDKVFIIFQRLHNKNQFSGTGIGLAICKKIVEKHEGRIWIESAIGQGSTFYFTIKK